MPPEKQIVQDDRDARAEELESAFSYDGYQVVRKELFAHFYDLNGDEIEKQTTEIKWDAEAAEKGGFEHFMMKEIHEQPKAVQDGAYCKRTSKEDMKLRKTQLSFHLKTMNGNVSQGGKDLEYRCCSIEILC